MARQMKDSGVEWIGQIPAEWKRVKLKEVTNIIMGQSPEAQDIKDFGNIPFMQGNREFGSIYPNAVKFCDNSPKKSRIGDILLSVRAPVGAINVSDKVYAIGRGLCSICATSINSKFLMYFLMLIMQDTKKFGQGSTFDAITIQELKQLPVLLPPINTQNRIASYLDRKCAQIDAIIAKQQQIIEKLKEYKLSVITEAVTKGLDPNVPMKDSGVEWIGKVPEGWIITSLRNGLSNIQTGPFGSQLHAEDYIENGIFVINPANIVDGEIIPDKKCSITNDKAAELSQHILKTGDILFARRGEMGRCAYFCDGIGRCLCGTGCIKLQCNKMLLPKFASWFLQMLGVKQYLSLHSVGTTMANLNSNIIAAIPTVLPPIKEQKQIVRYIENKMRSIQELQKKNESITKKLMDYKKSLIYEIVTGKREVF